MDHFATVEDCLRHHQKNRPQSFKEIALCVGKNEKSVAQELRRLQRRGEVTLIEVRFQNRLVPFYSLREAMAVELREYPGAAFRNALNK
jgi:predicted transcriptional regulator